MALFRNNSNGGIMDVIRCDDTDHLIWKWRPAGSALGETSRENSIRWGSTLRVKNGQIAVFVFHSNGGMVQDIIRGPYDSVLKTENLPVIAAAIGMAYNGTAPFQAEVYFINLSSVIQTEIGVKYFDVYDKNYGTLGVPVAVRGVITFKITDYEEFIEKYQLRDVTIDEFKSIIKPAVAKYVKSVVMNAPDEYGIPVTELQRRTLEINEIVEKYLKDRLYNEFGVTVSSIDLDEIDIDKTSVGFKTIMKHTNKDLNLTGGLGRATKATSQAVGIFSDAATRLTNTAAGMTETATGTIAGAFSKLAGTATGIAAQVGEVSTDIATSAVDVQEYKYAKHKKSQAGFVRSLIKGSGDLEEAEKRPRFTSRFAKNVSGLAGGLNSKKTTTDDDPPPLPTFNYRVAVDGQAAGPFDINGLIELFNAGKLAPDSLVWTKGMANWQKAGDVEDFAPFFEEDTDEAPPLPTDV